MINRENWQGDLLNLGYYTDSFVEADPGMLRRRMMACLDDFRFTKLCRRPGNKWRCRYCILSQCITYLQVLDVQSCPLSGYWRNHRLIYRILFRTPDYRGNTLIPIRTNFEKIFETARCESGQNGSKMARYPYTSPDKTQKFEALGPVRSSAGNFFPFLGVDRSFLGQNRQQSQV